MKTTEINWINPKDEKPPIDVEVLVIVKLRNVFTTIGSNINDEDIIIMLGLGIVNGQESISMKNIIYWAYLPEYD